MVSKHEQSFHFGRFLMIRLFPLCLIIGLAQFAQGEEPTASDYVKFFSYQVGEWESTAPNGQKGTLTITMSPTKNCLLGYATQNDKPSHQVVAAYDPEAKGWKRTLIGAEGWIATIVVQADKATVTGERKGAEFKGKLRFVSPDGVVQEAQEH